MSRKDEHSYLWDKSGDRDADLDELTGALASLRAPEVRTFARRRWLAPLAIALTAATLMLLLITPTRLPARLVGLVGGERGTTAMMIEGGVRLELDVVTRAGIDRESAARDLATRVSDAGLDVRFASDERIIAEYPGKLARFDGLTKLADHALLSPIEIAVVHASSPDLAGLFESLGIEADAGALDGDWPALDQLFRDRGLRIIRTGGTLYAIGVETALGIDVESLERDGATARIRLRQEAAQRLGHRADRIALLRQDIFIHHFPDLLGLGTLEGTEIRSTLNWPEELDPLVDHAGIGASAVLEIASAQTIEPSLSPARTWAARGLFGLLIGVVVFGIAGWIGRGARPLDPLVDADPGRRRRAGVVVSGGLGALVIGAGAIHLGRGPFIGAVTPGLLGIVQEASLLSLGYSCLAAGFVAALALTGAVRRLRPELVCDRSGGRRLVIRGLVMSAVAAVALLIAAWFDARLEILLLPWSSLDSAGFAAVAAALVAVVLLLGWRALGGPWLCASLAVLTGAALTVGRWFLEDRTNHVVDAGVIAAVVTTGAIIATATWALLSRPLGSPAAPVRAPVGGLMPLAAAIGIGSAIIYNLPHDVASNAWELLALRLAIAAPLLLLAVVVERRLRRGLGGARVSGIGGDGHRGERVALWLTFGFAAALLVVDTLATSARIATFAVLTALVTAAVMDLVTELRARWRRPQLRPAWTLHQPQLAGLVERALDGQGLDVHIRARFFRTALGIFGAFVPMTVMVDADRIDEARDMIGALLGCHENA